MRVHNFVDCLRLWDGRANARHNTASDDGRLTFRNLCSRCWLWYFSAAQDQYGERFEVIYNRRQFQGATALITYFADGSTRLHSGGAYNGACDYMGSSGQQVKQYLNDFSPCRVWQKDNQWYVAPRVEDTFPYGKPLTWKPPYTKFTDGMVINRPPEFVNDTHKSLYLAAVRGDDVALAALNDFMNDKGIK
jgi:hypothetical protein